MPRMQWVKLWTEEWLDGSIREYLTAEERSVWTDFLALAGRSRTPGLIQAGEDCPYTHSFLAARLGVPIELLDVTIKKCIDQNRISENCNGILIMNWNKYQSEYHRQKPYRQKAIQTEVEKGEGIKKAKETSVNKSIYGLFQNVLLTDDEYRKLKDKFSDLDDRIENFSERVESKGYKYKNHYAAILNWDRRDKKQKEEQRAKTGTCPKPGAPGYHYG